MADPFAELQAVLQGFAVERDWTRFHTPKNLAMAIAGEAGELSALLQWLTDDEVSRELDTGDLKDRLADEMADVLIYLTRLADVAEVDLFAAAYRKVEKNRRRYPAELVRGEPVKYSESSDLRQRMGD